MTEALQTTAPAGTADLSLAVPHGFRLAPSTDLPGLAARLRDALLPVRRRIEVAQVAGYAAQLLDQADLSGSDRPGSVIFDAVQAQADHVHQVLAGEHDCPLNVASVAVSDDPETGELYALFFHQHEEFADALDELEIGEYFPYWPEDEGERRPTGISRRQWAERAAVWTRVLRGEDPQRPGNMFKIDIGSPLPDMDLITQAEEVLAAMPTREQRVLHALNSFAQSQAEGLHSPTQVMDLMAQMPAQQARIEQALKPITLADIAGAGVSGGAR